MNFDSMLKKVIHEARAIGIPVAPRICPSVIINTRAKKRYGCCRKKGNKYVIELSARLYEAERPDVLAVIAHEVLHTCGGCMNHGARWKCYAAKLSNAYGYKITRTCEISGIDANRDESEATYLLRCMSCGASFPRWRRSAIIDHPELYHCRCGGALERVR